MVALKQKQLAAYLEEVPVFEKPKILLEQYPTPPHIASSILQYLQVSGDIEDLEIADLGCGMGVFTVGCCILGCDKMMCFDIDEAALDSVKETCGEDGFDFDQHSEGKIEYHLCDVTKIDLLKWQNSVCIYIYIYVYLGLGFGFFFLVWVFVWVVCNMLGWDFKNKTNKIVIYE